MPGSLHIVPSGTMCDIHQNVLATHRVQGETDSMGAELIDMCDECYKKSLEYKKSGICDFCSTEVDELISYRDPEEGTSSPVYEICQPCKDRRNKIDLINTLEYDMYSELD